MLEFTNLLKLYIPLISWVGLGIVLGRILPKTIPAYLGKFLFWLGVPVGIVIFLRQADLSASIWLAPLISWLAVLLGAALAWSWIQGQLILTSFLEQQLRKSQVRSPLLQRFASQQLCQKPSQGSFLLSTMVGNTGYLGYPVTLALVGPQYFGWAIFYDTLGSTLAAYGLGVVLAAYFGMKTPTAQGRVLLNALLKNPALWSFWLGLGVRSIPLAETTEQVLRGCAWSVIALSLLLLGMRLSQLQSWQNIQPAAVSLGIKMVVVPLAIGYLLSTMGISGAPRLVLVLQAAMPPAFATLVIAEAYDLDRDLSVATLAMGSIAILLLLPVWLWLFGS
ncbi:MAG: AEC family transporter [Elainellaceae cyanobacterium]